MQSNFRHIAEEIRREIEESISRVGLLSRVFARGKDPESLKQKLTRDAEKYRVGGKLVQDVIGLRVALYFPEDVSIVKCLLEDQYKIDLSSTTIDIPTDERFSVTRYNLIFKLPEEHVFNFNRNSTDERLDKTFEVQLRSILSEGWHEVEHDLRYKAKSNWERHSDLGRMLNGVVATIETAEWTMSRIFEELAFRHYKEKNWSAMLPNLLKLRLKGDLSESLIAALNSDTALAKELLRIDRSSLIVSLHRTRPRIPITTDNLIFFWNALGPQDESILSFTPQLINDSVKSHPTIK
jgi:ppGpp synthetase/RelA/SpoT-type nucleotidyltranferase